MVYLVIQSVPLIVTRSGRVKIVTITEMLLYPTLNRLGYLRRSKVYKKPKFLFYYISPIKFVTISDFLSLYLECLLSENLVPWENVTITELSLYPLSL